jgi:hypothetical protein
VQLLVEYLADLASALHEDDPGHGGIGDLDDEAVARAYLLLHRAEARADRCRSKLGLDPLSAARLGRDIAAGQVDMARLMAEISKQRRTEEQP